MQLLSVKVCLCLVLYHHTSTNHYTSYNICSACFFKYYRKFITSCNNSGKAISIRHSETSSNNHKYACHIRMLVHILRDMFTMADKEVKILQTLCSVGPGPVGISCHLMTNICKHQLSILVVTILTLDLMQNL